MRASLPDAAPAARLARALQPAAGNDTSGAEVAGRLGDGLAGYGVRARAPQADRRLEPRARRLRPRRRTATARRGGEAAASSPRSAPRQHPRRDVDRERDDRGGPGAGRRDARRDVRATARRTACTSSSTTRRRTTATTTSSRTRCCGSSTTRSGSSRTRRSSTPAFYSAWDEGYAAVNAGFAAAVLEELERDAGAAVFFHDYHLYLAPRLVRDRRPRRDADAFRARPVAAAGRVARPAEANARRHPRRSRRKRRDRLSHGPLAAQLSSTACESFVGDDVDARNRDGADLRRSRGVRRVCRERGCAGSGARDRRDAAGQLVVRVDRTDPSKNIVRGFRAFELYLDEHPESAWAGRDARAA